MKKVLLIIILLIAITGLCACGGMQDYTETKPSELIQKEHPDTNSVVAFERVDIDDLPPDIKGSIQQKNNERGCKLLDSSDKSQYLVVYAGEKPTEGYGIEITQIVDNNGMANVTIAETTPKKGDMVAQVLTYPMDIVRLLTRISGAVNLISVEACKEAIAQSGSHQIVASVSTMGYIQCEYIGLIGSNTIKVLAEDNTMVFRLTETTKELVSAISIGDIIGIDYQQNEQGDNFALGFSQKSITAVYQGQMDPHSIEVIKDDKPLAIQLTGNALQQVGELETGDIIKIIYSENEYGQMVASELIRIEK
ncbi:MAG: protease complex subunit PrcB family protein [Christensenellales bacterium]|jgi:hypothetical protein